MGDIVIGPHGRKNALVEFMEVPKSLLTTRSIASSAFHGEYTRRESDEAHR